MPRAKQVPPLTLRLSDDLRERLRSKAKENGQSLNACIVDLLERGLSIGTAVEGPEIDEHALPKRPPIRERTARPQLKARASRPRSEACVHRRPPDQFCSRCDG